MKPGGPPSWGAGGKSAVGTAIGDASCVWFTMVRGYLTEVYYPRPDIANTRAIFLVVTDESGFFCDERSCAPAIRMQQPGIPIYESEYHDPKNRYSISTVTCTDPFRHALLQRIRFNKASPDDGLQLWVLLAPALDNRAYGNSGWLDREGALVIARESLGMALTVSTGFSRAGCTYQGPSDLWHQLKSGISNEKLPDRADDGNILLGGQITTGKSDSEVVLALAFAESAHKAMQTAADSLSQGFDRLAGAYVEGWREYRSKCVDLPGISTDQVYEASIAVLKIHQSKQPPGGLVASLGVPWGDSEQQALDFRYQMAWTRDAVESASAFLAIGDSDSARLAWHFLDVTQMPDGHSAQNMWLDGAPHWNGIQMDETGMPILLADLLCRHNILRATEVWPTVRRAAEYLIQHGPRTEEDRWENAGGYSPYTLPIEIAALLAAAEIGDLAGDKSAADYLRAVADWWNDNVERWTYIDDHYVRLSAAQQNRAGEIQKTTVRNRAQSHSPASLALVRFGLRAAGDPRMLKTIADIDRRLKSETATGTIWHRYPDDHYGEYEDGAPFDGSGIGRGWPLLAGERAHYELARGHFEEARRLASIIEKQTNACGFIPEQVWDKADLPAKGLYNGRPSGSAMPLLWAHAEYIKLLRSLRDGAIFDMPPQPIERYQKRKTKSVYAFWRPDHKLYSLPAGKILRIESPKSAIVYWTLDDWNTVQSVSMRDSELGLYYCDLPTSGIEAGRNVGFTFRWNDQSWENRAYELAAERAA